MVLNDEFRAAVAAHLLANIESGLIHHNPEIWDHRHELYVEWAVKITDLLIKELNKPCRT